MRIQQFIKKLNNTELGKGNAHETYVSVPKKSDVRLIFNPENLFEDINLKIYDLVSMSYLDNIRYGFKKANKEWRITGLGKYYRDNEVNAGDEIVFERQDDGTKTEFFINLKTKENIIIFQKNSRGFEVLNSDRLDLLMTANRYQDKVSYNGSSCLSIIEFKESAKKRADSPDETDWYSISFNGQDILNDLKSNEYLELSNSVTNKFLKKIVVWQSYEFNL